MIGKRKQREQTWRPGPEYRVICDCQRHARPERSAFRQTLRLASRGAAVLVGIPLAFATLDLPGEAMNLSLAHLRVADLRQAQAVTAPTVVAPVEEAVDDVPEALPIFTTDAVRAHFLEREQEEPQRTLTLDAVKESYFRTKVPYGAIIYREARRNDLLPELVAAIVQTESNFRPRLVSHKSAQGLMQIVPGTARLLGVEDPFDPEENIAAGTRYFRELLNRYNDQTMALAAYNAGPGNVARFGGIPPFAETRAYVAKVNRRTHRYRQRIHNNFIAAVRVRPGDE